MGDRLATIDTGRKVGAAVRLFVGELRPHLTMSPGPRPTSVQNGILIHLTVWQQYTNATDKQDRQGNGPVAWGEPLGLLVTVAQKGTDQRVRTASITMASMVLLGPGGKMFYVFTGMIGLDCGSCRLQCQNAPHFTSPTGHGKYKLSERNSR